MHHLIRLIPLCLAIAACGGTKTEIFTPVEETSLDAPPSASEASDKEATPKKHADSDDFQTASGKIQRDELLKVLAKGPGALLAMVETEPYRRNGRFVGFKIVRFASGAPGVIYLRRGDVIKAVNGLPVASPDDYFRAFQELQVASELRFDILRDDAPLLLTYPIIESLGEAK
jgi:type II secretory pathway component PulC